MDMRHTDEIRKDNRKLRKQLEGLEGQNTDVDYTLGNIIEDEEAAARLFSDSRERSRRLRRDIEIIASQASGQMERTARCAREIQACEQEIGKIYTETHNSTHAMKQSRRLVQQRSEYYIMYKGLRNAVAASFLNPDSHLVREEMLRKTAERYSLYFTDEWLAYAFGSLYLENEEEQIHLALQCNPFATCLFMAVFRLAGVDRQSDGISSCNSGGESKDAGRGAGERTFFADQEEYWKKREEAERRILQAGGWLNRLSILLEDSLTGGRREKSQDRKNGQVRAIAPDSETLRITELFILLYAVLAGSLDRVMFKGAPDLRARVSRILDHCIFQEGLDSAATAWILRREETDRENLSEDEENPEFTEAGDWEKAHLFTEMENHCPTYAELSKILGLACGSRRIYADYVSKQELEASAMHIFLRKILQELTSITGVHAQESEMKIHALDVFAATSGNREEADRYLEQEKERAREYHVILHISDRILEWEKTGGRQTGLRRCLLELLLETDREAAKDYVKAYRDKYHENWPVHALSYQKEIDFGKGMDEALQDAERHYQRISEQKTSSKLSTSAILCILAAVVFGAGLTWLGQGTAAISAAAVFLALAAILTIRWQVQRESMKRNLTETAENVQGILRLLFAEFDEIRALYKEYDQYGTLLMEL